MVRGVGVLVRELGLGHDGILVVGAGHAGGGVGGARGRGRDAGRAGGGGRLGGGAREARNGVCGRRRDRTQAGMSDDGAARG